MTSTDTRYTTLRKALAMVFSLMLVAQLMPEAGLRYALGQEDETSEPMLVDTLDGWSEGRATVPEAAPEVSVADKVEDKDAELPTTAQDPQLEAITIVLDANGGTGNMDDVTLTPDDTAWTLPACTYAREGYQLVGWSTTPDGADEEDDPATEADEYRVAVAVPDGQALTRLSFELEVVDEDGATHKETRDLISWLEAGHVTLYAQWEVLPQEDLQEGADQLADPTDSAAITETPESPDDALLQEDELTQETLAVAGATTTRLSVPRRVPTAGATTVATASLAWRAHSDGSSEPASTDTLVLAPTTNDVTEQAWELKFSVTGDDDFQPGTVEITLPATIWQDRDGAAIGRLSVAVPEDPGEGSSFAWRQVGESVVITNKARITAGRVITIQGRYLGLVASKVKDGSQATLQMQIAVEGEDGTVTASTNELAVTLNTGVDFSAVNPLTNSAYNKDTKRYSVWYGEDARNVLPQELLAKLDEGKDYAVVRWRVAANLEASQPFRLELLDASSFAGVASADGQEGVAGTLLGVECGSTVVAYDESMPDAPLSYYTGHSSSARSAYVWVAYPADGADGLAPGVTYEAASQAKVRATGTDDSSDVHELTATSEQPVRLHAPASYKVRVVWEGEPTLEGGATDTSRRPAALSVRVVRSGVDSNGNPWKSSALSVGDGNEQTWEFSDDGDERAFTVSESALAKGRYVYDDNGLTTEVRWGYTLVGGAPSYDEATRTYTFTNRYDSQSSNQPGAPSPTAQAADVATGAYDSSNAASEQNRALRQLLSGEDALVELVSSAKIQAAEKVANQAIPPTVTYALEAGALTLRDDSHDDLLLGTGDYEIESITPSLAQLYRYYWDYEPQEMEGGMLPAGQVTVWYRTATSAVWQTCATMNSTGIHADSSLLGVSVSGTRLFLPSGTTQVRLTTSSNAAQRMSLSCGVRYRLRPSDAVRGRVQELFAEGDVALARVNNTTVAQAWIGDDAPFVNAQADGVAWLHGRAYRLATDLVADQGNIESDTSLERFRVPISLTLAQQSTATNKLDWASGVADGSLPVAASGTFYALLPHGFSCDVSTAKVDGNNVDDAWTIYDYQGSGRELVVVRVSLDTESPELRQEQRELNESDTYEPTSTGYPARGFYVQHTLELDAYCTWDARENYYSSEKDRGHVVAAFESDATMVGTLQGWEGEPDAPTQDASAVRNITTPKALADETEASLMTDLDARRSDPAFVYAGYETTIGATDITQTPGVTKRVSSGGNGAWKVDATVREGDAYGYRLRYLMSAEGNAASGETGELGFLDVLDGAGEEGSSWRGTLMGVDTSDISAQGGHAQVWYYTGDATTLTAAVVAYAAEVGAEGFSGDHKTPRELVTEGWVSELTDANRAQVTAVWVDASQKANGSVFALPDGNSVYVLMGMRAPVMDAAGAAAQGLAEDTALSAQAKNVAWAWGKHDDRNGTTKFSVTPVFASEDNGGMPTVVSIKSNTVTTTITWDDEGDNDRMRPEGAKLVLAATDRQGETYTCEAAFTAVTDDDTAQQVAIVHVPVVGEHTSDHLTWNLSVVGADGQPIPGYEVQTNVVGTKATARLTHQAERVEVPYRVEWKGDDLSVRPSTVRVRLTRDDTDTGSSADVVAGEEDAWAGFFADLLRYDRSQRNRGDADGVGAYRYAVAEDYVPGYHTTATYDANTGTYVFTNTYDPYGDLRVSLALNEEAAKAKDAATRTYPVVLSVWDEDGEPREGVYSYDVYARDADVATATALRSGRVEHGGELQLAAGEQLVVRDLPSESTYAVTLGEASGFSVVAATGDTGSIFAGMDVADPQVATATLTLGYATSGSATVGASVTLSDRALRRQQFSFELFQVPNDYNKTAAADVRADGDSAGSDVIRLRLASNGTATNTVQSSGHVESSTASAAFADLRYTLADAGNTYRYAVVINVGDGGCYTATPQVAYVTVTVVDDGDGTMTCTVDPAAPTFQVAYTATGTAELVAYKRIEGGKLEDYENFSFQALPASEAEGTYTVDTDATAITAMSDKTNDGVIRLQVPLTQEAIGTTLHYVATELEPAAHDAARQTGVIYTKEAIGYDVVVTDDGAGNLSFAVTPWKAAPGEGEGTYTRDTAIGFTPVFTNTLEDGQVTIRKVVDNDSRYKDTSQTFDFQIRLTGDEGRVPDALQLVPQEDIPQVSTHATSHILLPSWLTDAAAAGWDFVRGIFTPRVAYAEEDTDPAYSGTAYAVLDDEGTLTFFRSTNTYANGTQVTDAEDIKGNKYSGTIWTGLETNTATHPWNGAGYKGLVKQAKVAEGQKIAPKNCKEMFSGCSSLISADLSGFDTSNVTTMQSMFQSCSGLTSLNISNFDTSNVTTMGNMFWTCSSLTSLDVTKFNTSNVTDMGSMFYGCSKLTSLDVSKLDTSSVTNMYAMFHNCSGLTSLDVSNFNTSNVKSTRSMFGNCSSLSSLDLSNFDTSKVETMHDMFYGCSGLASLNVTSFDTGNVEDMSEMFLGCRGLTSLDVSNFDTSKVTDMGNMFNGCSGLTSLDVTKFNTSSVTSMGNMFLNCKSLTSLNVSGLDTSKVTTMVSMFNGCSGLTALDVSGFDTRNVTNMQSMFNNCSGLTSLDVSDFDTSKVTQMNSMFDTCSNLTSLDVSSFDTSKVTNMANMFNACKALTSLDASGFDTSNVTNMSRMFSTCNSLISVDVSKFDTSKVTNMNFMFWTCSSLTSLDVSGFDTSGVAGMQGMFYSCSKLTSLDVTNFDTSSATDMINMFYNCSGLTSLDVSSFDTSNVTSMGAMFRGCSGLTSLDVSSFDTSSVTSMRGMFIGCSGLTSLDVSSFDTSKVTDMASMFYGCSGLTSLDVSSFDTSKVTDMANMFNGCSGLTSLDVSSFDTSNVTLMSSLFNNTNSLSAVTLGSKFSFRGGGISATNNCAVLITPSTKANVNTGKWVLQSMVGTPEEANYTKTAAELRDGYDGNVDTWAGTWVWQTKDNVASLSFVTANGSIVGQAVYTDTLVDGKATFSLLTGDSSKESYASWPGHTLVGWGTQSDGSDVVYPVTGDGAASTVDVTSDKRSMVLYARWAAGEAPEGRDGVFNFSLDRNKQVTYTIPAGLAYEVWENTPAGWVLVSSSDTSGVVAPAAQKVATFENSYDPKCVSVVLRGQKLLDGEPAEAGEFSFALEESTTPAVGEGLADSYETTVKNGAGGQVAYAPISMPAHYDGSGAIEAYTRTFTIAEATDAASRKAGVEYDTTTWYADVTVGDMEPTGAPDGVPEAKVAYYTMKDGIREDAADGLVFRNTTAKHTLTVTTVVDSGRVAPDFDVVLELTGNGYDPVTDPAGAVKTLAVSGGAEVSEQDILYGTGYRLRVDNLPAGWSLDSANTDLEGALTDDATVELRLSYTATGTFSITAYKQLVGGTPAEGAFKFELVDSGDKVVATATNDGWLADEPEEGATRDPHYGMAPIHFDRVSTSVAGAQTYTVREVAGADAAVEYDAVPLTVNVIATDDGSGGLACTASFTGGNDVLVNHLRTGTLTVTKSIEQATTASESTSFPFELALVDVHGVPVSGYTVAVASGSDPAVETDDQGVATFHLAGGQSATFAVPQGASYEVRETGADGWTQTNATGATGTMDAAGAVANFTNTYASAGTATISVQKSYDREMSEGQFAFRLLGENGTVLQEVRNKADGTVEFLPLAYTQADDGKHYTYRIVEVAGGRDDIAYDDTVIEATVTPADDGHGHMTCNVTYNTGTNPGFANLALLHLPFTGLGGVPVAALWIALAALGWGLWTLSRRRSNR